MEIVKPCSDSGFIIDNFADRCLFSIRLKCINNATAIFIFPFMDFVKCDTCARLLRDIQKIAS